MKPTYTVPLDTNYLFNASDQPALPAIRPVPPAFTILTEPKPEERPFEDNASLSERIFRQPMADTGDPAVLAAEKAMVLDDQLHLLIDQMASRHAISYSICQGLDEEEGLIRTKLDQVERYQLTNGMGSKFESDLIKQLQGVAKERRAESVSCWRDTGRVIKDICDLWIEHQEQEKKTRLMEIDL